MCELLALNANTPTDMGFSFRGLSRRGGVSGEHADGWGLASFKLDGHGLTLLREEAPAAFSALADQLAERSPKALVSIAHDPSVAGFHQRRVHLTPADDGARLADAPLAQFGPPGAQ